MTQYIDPNSGAAPQPGGYIGAHGAELGHAMPTDEEVEQKRLLNQPLEEFFEYPESKLEETLGDDEEDEEDEEGEGVINAPAELIETPDGDTVTEEEASDAKALETEGVNLENSEEDTENEAEGEQGAESVEGEDNSEQEAYDPSQYSVPEVNDYLEAHPEQRDAVIEAERAGKARKGITGDE